MSLQLLNDCWTSEEKSVLMKLINTSWHVVLDWTVLMATNAWRQSSVMEHWILLPAHVWDGTSPLWGTAPTEDDMNEIFGLVAATWLVNRMAAVGEWCALTSWNSVLSYVSQFLITNNTCLLTLFVNSQTWTVSFIMWQRATGSSVSTSWPRVCDGSTLYLNCQMQTFSLVEPVYAYMTVPGCACC